jgi:hypothetical protein
VGLAQASEHLPGQVEGPEFTPSTEKKRNNFLFANVVIGI